MMTVFVGDILNATAAPVVAYAGSTRTLQWLRNGSAIPSATATAYRVTDAEIANAISVLQLETNFMGSASAISAPTATVQAWSPSTLFALSEPGVWFDPSDLTTMFQDAATPVTAPAQPVGLVLDKSQGLVLGSELRGTGTISTTGTVGFTPSYNATTGAGVIGRVDVSNRAGVVFSGLTSGGFYVVDIENLSTSTMSVALRTPAIVSGFVTSTTTIDPGQRRTQRVFIVTGGANQTAFAVGDVGSAGTANIIIHSVRELPGFHATQSTAANRPTYGVVPSRGRVNLLTFTEQFDNAAWSKARATVSANSTTAPDGTVTADTVTNTNGESSAQVNQTVSLPAATHTVSFWVMGGTTSTVVFGVASGSFLSGTATKISGPGSISGTTLITLTGLSSTEWTRVSFTFTAVSGNNIFAIYPETTALGTGKSVILWGAQLELGSTATTYQRVASQFDVTDPAGFPSYPLHYLFFGGDLDPRWLQTPTITPNADKVQVFAGVRKLSDAAEGFVAELSADLNSNSGTFYLTAPIVSGTTRSYGGASRGTFLATVFMAGNTIPAPTTNVLSFSGDISGDLATLRINGTQAAQSTANQGTGNFLAYPLYIGRHGGASLAFNGQLYGLIVRFGANLSTSVINRAEYFVSQKTGVTL